MKPPASKTVHADERPSFAGNLVTIFAGRAERTAETTAMRQSLPGRSHVGRILLSENTSQERLLGMRLSDIQGARRKTAAFIAHQRKTFVARMEQRQGTWVREHSRRAGILNAAAGRQRDALAGGRAGPRDRAAGAESPPTGEAAGDAQAGTNPVPQTGEPTENGRGSLPEIGSARTGLPRGRRGDAVARIRSYPPTELSLPGIPDSTRADEAKLPSVLITAAEGDAAESNEKAAVRSPGGSAGGEPGSRRRKKPRDAGGPGAFAPPRLSGPSPTFISEVLPRIQIRDCLRMPSHLSKKATGRRRRRRRTQAEAGEGDPLEDDRFLRLQHTLAPHPAWPEEPRNLASITSGVVTAKKLASEKLRKMRTKVDEDFQHR